MLIKIISILLVVSTNFGSNTSTGIITFTQSIWNEKFQTIHLFKNESPIEKVEEERIQIEILNTNSKGGDYTEPINILNTKSINLLTQYFSSRLKLIGVFAD